MKNSNTQSFLFLGGLSLISSLLIPIIILLLAIMTLVLAKEVFPSWVEMKAVQIPPDPLITLGNCFHLLLFRFVNKLSHHCPSGRVITTSCDRKLFSLSFILVNRNMMFNDKFVGSGVLLFVWLNDLLATEKARGTLLLFEKGREGSLWHQCQISRQQI